MVMCVLVVRYRFDVADTKFENTVDNTAAADDDNNNGDDDLWW